MLNSATHRNSIKKGTEAPVFDYAYINILAKRNLKYIF